MMRATINVLLIMLAMGSQLVARGAHAATIELRRADGQALNSEIGDIINFEVVIHPQGESLTGFSFFVSFDSNILQLLPQGPTWPDGSKKPFAAGGHVRGLELDNKSSELEGEMLLSYSQVVRLGVGEGEVKSESSVVATFAVEVLRRPLGDLSTIRLEERGHNRRSRYVTLDDPGVEKLFAQPLGSVGLRIKGFRILPLDDIVLVEGESPDSLILDDFVDQEGAQVVWFPELLSQIQTTLLPAQRNKILFAARANAFGTFPNRNDSLTVELTAVESGGLIATDTITILVRARPVIDGLPETITFLEDETNDRFVLSTFVTDADASDSELVWHSSNGSNVSAEVDSQSQRVTFSAAANWSGEESITLTVTDGHGLSSRAQVRVVVTEVNDPPQPLRRLPVYPVAGGDAVTVPLADLVVDVDDANLNITPQSDAGVLAQTENGLLSITGVTPGRSIIDLGVSDLSGEETTTRLVAVVLQPGQRVSPKISPLPELQFKAGELGELDLRDLVIDDGLRTMLSWTAQAGEELAGISVFNDRLTVGAADGFSGSSSVILTVRDGNNDSDTATLPVRVLEASTSAPPVISAPSRIGLVSAGKSESNESIIDLDELVSDADDGDADITWQAEVPTRGATAQVEGRTLTLNAIEGLFGIGALNLVATDQAGNRDSESLELVIVEPGSAPRIATFDPIVADSLAAVIRIDLDRFVFDGEDFPAELVWAAEPQPGVAVELDPATHVLTIRRDDPAGEAPLSSNIRLEATDTDGLVSGPAFIRVGLPPIFELEDIADIEFFTGDIDSSLILNDHVIGTLTEPLAWVALKSESITMNIDSVTSRVRLSAREPGFVGGETLLFSGTDESERSRTAAVRVTVKSRGLAPEIRQLSPIEVTAGGSDTSIDLDEIVIDDDADSLLVWKFVTPPTLTVVIDSLTNVVTITADSTAAGMEQLQLFVSDPAGNNDLAVLAITILRGGLPPVISTLPQVFLASGVPEVRLSLDLFVTDLDTPDDEIAWTVNAIAGIGARIENRVLFVSVPPGQAGTRRLSLVASDPQLNTAAAQLTVIIESDTEVPTFMLQVSRNEVFPDLLEVEIEPSEKLLNSPTVTFSGSDSPVGPGVRKGSFRTIYTVPRVAAPQLLQLFVSGDDLAGNTGTRELFLVMQRLEEGGATVAHPDGLTLNVPDAAASPGRLAIIYRLGEEERPAGSEGEAVYFVDLAAGGRLDQPVTLNLFRGAGAAGQEGLLRRNPDTGIWDEQPTIVDPASGWITVSLTEPGLYRPGTVSETNRRTTQKLAIYPNPFPGDGGGATTQVEYELTTSGPVMLHVYNILGQRVKVLVDEEFQDAGIWTVFWDGRDDEGRMLSNGVYFYDLMESAERNCRRVLLMR